MTAAKPVSAVVTYHFLDGQPVGVYEDPVAAQNAVDQQREGACCTDVVRATSFRSASRISQILKETRLFPKGQERVGTRVRGYTTSYEGYVVEAGGIYGGFVSISWVLGTRPGRHRSHEEACEEMNAAYQRMAHRLTLRGFKVVTVPARSRAYSMSTGGVWVIGKEVAA